MSLKTVNDETFLDLVKQSLSMAHLLRLMGQTPTGGGYLMCKRRLEKLQLSTEHWTGGPNASVMPRSKKSDSEVFVERSTYMGRGRALKKRLLELGVPNACSICNITDWQGTYLSLQLDHINGVGDDNRVENLRLICPNCHSQTSTYCGKKLKKSNTRQCMCGATISARNVNGFCKICFLYTRKKTPEYQRPKRKPRPQKIMWPPLDELKARLADMSPASLGKELGVSGNAISKHMKSKRALQDAELVRATGIEPA